MELYHCINFLLSTAQHNVFQYLNEQLSVHGITPAQYGVLSCLWHNKSLTPKQIGETLYLEASSISSILDRMQKNDLIDREVDPDNRRTIIVSATEKGAALQKPVEKIIQEMNALVQKSFTETEWSFLTEALLTIAQRHLKED